MRKEYVLIGMLVLIFFAKLLMPGNEAEPMYSGSAGGADGEAETTSQSIDNIVEETNMDKLDLSEATIDSLTIDETTGEECNQYIPTLIESGSASYTISPDNTIFDYFCSQTVGGDDYSQLDLSGYEDPALIVGYFENIPMNGGTSYVGMSKFTDDLYLACFLETAPSTLNAGDTEGWWDQINCDISTIDSHNYFTSQKVLDPATNEFILTDLKMENGYFSEYMEELGKVQVWYKESGYKTVIEFTEHLPTESDLNLQLISYDVVRSTLEALQAEVKANYQQ